MKNTVYVVIDNLNVVVKVFEDKNKAIQYAADETIIEYMDGDWFTEDGDFDEEAYNADVEKFEKELKVYYRNMINHPKDAVDNYNMWIYKSYIADEDAD